MTTLQHAPPLDSDDNALASILTRVLKPPPLPDPAPVRRLFKQFLEEVISPEPIEPLEFRAWAKRFPLRHRLAMERDIKAMHGALRPRDKTVGAFTKIELGKHTDPRNISSRTLAYQGLLGPYIAAAEQYLSSKPWLVKHLTLPQRNAKLTELHSQVSPTVYVECDFSRFDSTVSQVLLECEHSVYRALFPNMPAIISELLDVQLNTKAFHVRGVAYTTVGRRCSGDPNTSIGNSILNYFCHWVAWRDMPNWASVHEGDDGLAFLSNPPPDYAERLERAATLLGLRIEVISHIELEQAKFCGRTLHLDHLGAIRCQCDFNRTIPKLGSTVTPTNNARDPRLFRKQLLVAKCMSYLMTDHSTPIVGAFCAAVVRAAHSDGLATPPARLFDRKHAMAISGQELSDVHTLAHTAHSDFDHRMAFYATTGIAPALQERFEAYYRDNIKSLDSMPGAFPLIPLPFSAEEFLVDSAKYIIHEAQLPPGQGQ